LEEDKFSAGGSEKEGLTRLDNLFGDVGIKLKHVAVNQHVMAVERRIRMIKERCRGIISTLPCRLCKKLLESLICRVTRRINMEPSSVNDGYGPTPWESYSGRKVNYSVTIKASFGEYCQATRTLETTVWNQEHEER